MYQAEEAVEQTPQQRATVYELEGQKAGAAGARGRRQDGDGARGRATGDLVGHRKGFV